MLSVVGSLCPPRHSNPSPVTCSPTPQKVFDKAEEMAARYKQMLLEQAEEGEESLGSMMI